MAALIAKLIPIGLMLMMFVVGLRLRLFHLKSVFADPRALGAGLVVQVLALPLLALFLGLIFGLSGPFLTGVVLAAAAPGGVTSNYIAHLVRADLGLSVALTLITTVLVSLTLPLVLVLTGQGLLPNAAALAKMSLAMGLVTLLPMSLGLAVRHWRPIWANVSLRVLDPIAKWAFAAMVLATFVQNRDVLAEYAARIGPVMILLNLGALTLATIAARALWLPKDQSRAIMVEASLQNIAVVLFVAGTILGNPALSVPGLIYAVVMNVSAVTQIAWTRIRRPVIPSSLLAPETLSAAR